MKEQKKYHRQKLAIIEMIEECDRRIEREMLLLKRYRDFPDALKNTRANLERYERIKSYLAFRY